MSDESHSTQAKGNRIILVTGPSGAGLSTAENILEDLDCEAIDNLPLSLLPRLLEGPVLDRPLALGVDVRNRDFSTQAVLEAIEALARDPRVELDVLYLDCSRDVLLRRFSETRRRHPMAPAETPEQGIDRELDLLEPIRLRADLLLDTSDLTPHDLRSEIARWFDTGASQRLAVSVHSFSYKRGVPRGLDMLFDCRFLRNPYWDSALRPLDGRDPAVAAYVEGDARYAAFFEKLLDLSELLLPAYSDEGKAHLSIGFGCTGGQHRSVVLSQRLAAALATAGWQVSIRHHELERRGRLATTSESGRKA